MRELDRRVHPTTDDPVVAGLSESVGGPMGARGTRHRWWSPVRVVLALAALTFAIGMVQKAPCYRTEWLDGELRYSAMCYSDVPYLYTGRGFAELNWPYDDDEQVRARYEVMEYPVGISYLAWANAHLTHRLLGAPDVTPRLERPVDEVGGLPGLRRETMLYVTVTAVGLGLATLLTAYFLAGANRGRPWDAAAFALAPSLALTALINWDLYALVFTAGALWAWARDRPGLTGVMIGLGTATKLFPLFLLGGVLVICWRRREWATFVVTSIAAAASWLAANAPAYLSGPEQWRVFWSFNSERGPDLGSAWLVAAQLGDLTITPETVNPWSWIFFVAWCAGVFVLGVTAPSAPRLAQLGFLVVAGFLLVNKVYSPQYVLWLLPLAVIARPRWRDLLIWQAGEILYFASVWWYLGGTLKPGSGDDAGFYWIAIALRLLAELYLVAIVVRDIRRPGNDPVDDREPVDPRDGFADPTHQKGLATSAF
jgi:uncharacterized membrane protein